MALKIEYFEGTLQVGSVDFEGSREEAIRAAEAGLEAIDNATQARVLDESGNVIALVHPGG
jgi:hypothetical protein